MGELIKGVREPLPYGRILLALIIASVAFGLIFTLSYSISYLNYQTVTDHNNIIEGYLDDLDVYAERMDCSEVGLYDSSERLDIVGQRLAMLETRFGKNDERVLDQKKLYTELELKHFQIIKGLNEDCNANFLPVFFFYSNSPADDRDERSENMGFILSAFKVSDPSRIMVYSFDFNLDSYVVDDFKAKFELVDAPMVVVNEDAKVYVRHIDDLNEYL